MALLLTGIHTTSGVTMISVGSYPPAEPPEMAGTYLGILGSETYEESGFFRMALNAKGRGTAVIKLGNDVPLTFRIPGAQTNGFLYDFIVIPPGQAHIEARSGKSSLWGKLIRQADGRTVFSGTIAHGARMVSVNARTALRTSDASQAGIYTLALTNNTGGAPLPSGTAGIGVVKVSKAGRVRFSALLSNGQILTQGSQLSDDGSWLLSAKSGRDNALVGGAVTFVDQPGSDLQGELSWTRPERLKGNRVVQSSASTSLLIAGSTYTASQGISTQEGRPAGWRLYIEGVDHSVSCNVALLQHGQLRTTPIEGGRASVRFVKPLGFVAGNYVKDGERVRRSLLGVLFQKTGEVVGLADRPGRGGSFSMTPSSEAAGSGGSAGAVKEGSGTVVISDLGSGTEIVGGGIPSGPIGSIQLGDSNGTTAGE